MQSALLNANNESQKPLDLKGLLFERVFQGLVAQ